MEKSNLRPFLRENLDILFIGLNPARGSSLNKHYFSVNQAFWNQLFESGLINKQIDKSKADSTVFGSEIINRNNWSYGITDLVTEIAESDSSKIKPTTQDCGRLKSVIIKCKPRVGILLHSKVLDSFIPYIGHQVPQSNSGKMGKIIKDCETVLFNIAFPHGNTIKSIDKIKQYKEVINYLEIKN